MKKLGLILVFAAGLNAYTAQTWNFDGAGALTGWNTMSNPSGAGFVITTSADCQSGQCLTMISPSVAPSNSYGALSRSYLTSAWLGQAIRFRAFARGSDDASGYLWMNISDGKSTLSFGMSAYISGSAWQDFHADLTVPSNARYVYFGAVVLTGQIWIDNASFQITDPQAPRALTETGLANLKAFGRLAGYIRHFHPSDQAASVDWDAFTIRGVRAVESAGTPDELAATLQSLFGAIAPTLRIFPGGQQPDIPPELRPGPAAALQIVRWNHFGVGLADSNIYHSERQSAPAGSGLPEGFQDPALPYVAEIGRGLSVAVPLSLYADAGGTLPHASYTDPAADPAVPEDRSTRLAGVILAWNVIQHFYPYFDVVDTDWPAALDAALTTAATDSGADDYMKTLKRLVAAQKDGHGYVWKTVSTTATTIAPVAWDWIENQLVVAYNPSGLGPQAGDRILKIDGRPTEDVIEEQKQLVSGATTQWILHRALSSALTCNASGKMQLEFEPFAMPGTSQSTAMTCGTATVARPRGEVVHELEPGIFYLDLNRVTADDWSNALPRLATANGIVFDLRGYPQTLTYLANLAQSNARSEQWHVPTPAKPDRTDMALTSEYWTVPPGDPYLTARRVFLTDGEAVSAAETVMGIVSYYKLAEIVGGPTAGTNGNINRNTIPGGFIVSFTGMKVLLEDGSQYHGVGVHPTIPSVPTRAGLAAGKDEVLQRGIEVLKWPTTGPASAIATDGVRSAATQLAGPIAPGERVTVTGTNLGPATAVDSAYDISGYLWRSAGDAKVFFDDIQAPLVRASATETVAIAPYKIAGPAAKVRVEFQGRASNEITVPVAAAAPGIFAVDGTTRASATNQDGTANSQANAARRGEIVTLYATGEGLTAPALMDGQRPAVGKWPAPAAETAVTIDGMAAEVVFKGEIEPGLLQLNVRVPTGVTAGNAVPVVLTVGGKTGAGVRTIAIQ